jgi:hypothetical protein
LYLTQPSCFHAALPCLLEQHKKSFLQESFSSKFVACGKVFNAPFSISPLLLTSANAFLGFLTLIRRHDADIANIVD